MIIGKEFARNLLRYLYSHSEKEEVYLSLCADIKSPALSLLRYQTPQHAEASCPINRRSHRGSDALAASLHAKRPL
jgi:hypothetical protein